MKFPVIRLPKFVNIIILVVSLFIAGITLLFGLGHVFGALFEGRNPNIPDSEHLKGVIIVVVLCLIGILFLLIGIAAAKGINEKIKKKQSEKS